MSPGSGHAAICLSVLSVTLREEDRSGDRRVSWIDSSTSERSTGSLTRYASRKRRVRSADSFGHARRVPTSLSFVMWGYLVYRVLPAGLIGPTRRGPACSGS